MPIARPSCSRVSLLRCDSFRFRRWSATSGRRVWMSACACVELLLLSRVWTSLTSSSSHRRAPFCSPVSVFTDSRSSFWCPIAPFFRRLWTCCAPTRMRAGAGSSMRFRRAPGLSLRRSSAAVLILRRLRGGISDRLAAISRRMTRGMRRSWGGG